MTTMHRSLEGIRVIAIEQAVAAPLCTRHLADLGADVIKIERPGGGDFARDYDDFVAGESSHFVWLNRGKRSVVLDLKSPDGVAALRALLETADVLVSNLAPGALERILPDEELDGFERLIRCHISGYGVTGPYADRKAYDLLIQGEAGVIAATGTPEQNARPGVSLADLAGGTYALAAINAALVERQRSGTGRRIDIAMFDVLLEWMSPLLLATKYNGETPTPAGRGHASITPYGPYATADGDEIQIAVQNDGQWRRLCETVIRRSDLAESSLLATNTGRLRERSGVEAAVANAIGQIGTAEVIERLRAADVPYGALNTVADVIEHPQALSRHRWESIRTQSGSHVSVVTPPFIADPSVMPERCVPALGQHTQAVLAELRERFG
ncbi:CaiB/BaiF CoA transferase family protein [Glaciibacter superstes]|uniref:CaiB/BaiF CoA transferase family protein n=1 Tax=Glaciibacter superstes TaxID=501023 RepID=UPI0003B74A9E|nr:CaiB/BaiF CoA-transferase family protein [Glaciibacter superstes]